MDDTDEPEGADLNIINEKVVLRLCVRFLFCVFPELHWLRQELAEERNPRGISNRPVAPSDWLASAGLGVMPSRRVDQSEGATAGYGYAPRGSSVLEVLACSLSQSRGTVQLEFSSLR